MTKSKIDKLLVLGSGVLGGQIAFQSAYKGKQVTVYDSLPTAKNAMRNMG